MKTTIQSIAPEELFHQIALMSVKPFMTTTQNDDLMDSKGKNHSTYGQRTY